MRKSRVSECKQKLASCLPSVSDYYGAKLHEIQTKKTGYCLALAMRPRCYPGTTWKVVDAFEKCKKWCIFTLEKCKYCTKNTLEKCIFFEVLACFSESCCPGTIFPHIYDSLLGTDSIRRKHLSVWPDGIEITTCAVTLRRRGKLLMPFSADFKEKPRKPSCLYVGHSALCDASHIFFLVCEHPDKNQWLTSWPPYRVLHTAKRKTPAF